MHCFISTYLCLLACAPVYQDTARGDEHVPVASVQILRGIPVFTVDHQIFMIPGFETYVPEQHYFEQFAGAGTALFVFNTNAAACDYGHSRQVWLDPETWDYTGLNERFDRVLAAKPDALVMLRVNLGTPRWWLDTHPDEMEVLHTGAALYDDTNTNPTIPRGRPFPSLASDAWRRDIGGALERLLDYIGRSPYNHHVFGYVLTGLDTEEWYHWSSGSNQLAGYSRHTGNAFREWIRRKYGSDDALRIAWRQPLATIETVNVPSYDERWDMGQATFRNPETKMPVIDFYQFYNELIPETIEYFSNIVRSKTGGKKVVGAFYGYMYEFMGDPEFGHNALERFLRIPSLDFMCVTASYAGREFARGGDYLRSPAHSVMLHKKLWYHDNDVVSFLAPEVMKRVGMHEGGEWTVSQEHHLKVLGYTETPQQTRWMFRRCLGFTLCNGAYQSYFDLHGGYYNHPILMEEIAYLNRVAASSTAYDRDSISEILIVADECSCAHLTFRHPLLQEDIAQVQQQLIKIGAPVDHVLMADLPSLDLQRYKMVVFLNCYCIPQNVRSVIRELLMRDGRRLVWCYAPGYHDDYLESPGLMRDLTGMDIQPADDATPTPTRMTLTTDHYGAPGDMMGTDTPTRQLFFVSDPDAVALGIHNASGKVVFAECDMGAWVSIYLLTSNIPAAVYRTLARKSGVHLFNDRDDTLYVNKSFLCLHANGAGERMVRLPFESDIYDMISECDLGRSTNTIRRDFQNGETMLIRWQPADR